MFILGIIFGLILDQVLSKTIASLIEYGKKLGRKEVKHEKRK